MSRPCTALAILLGALLSAATLIAADPESADGAQPPAAPADTPPTPETVTPELAAKAAAVTPLVLLLRDDRVRTELQLNSRQIAAVNAALADVQDQLWHVRDLHDPATDAGRGRVYDHLRKAVTSTCENSQIDRLDGLLLHAVGWRGIRLEQFQSKLNLSAKQLSRIAQLLEPPPNAPADSTLTPAQLKSLEAVLQPPQQRTVAQILGPQFDLSQLPTRHCPAPEFAQISTWINTDPLRFADLRGKVVAVHFWAFGCINCIRNIPHYESWFQKYRGRDLVIVGIHTPETSAEREIDAVRSKVAENKMQYPIAIDGSGATWTAYANAWWPSVYLIDKRGYVRYWWYGELNWKDAKGEEIMRRRIDALLAEK